MAHPYYNTGTNHTDYTQSHTLPQSPFQQPHTSTTTATATTQHVPMYQHSQYTVHPLPHNPHAGYPTSGDHGVLQYTPPTMHHPHETTRWVNSLDASEDDILKYRQDEAATDYEMDHTPQDHQQQQHLQTLQAPTESQSHANVQTHPPITSVSNQAEQVSPASRPGVIRTGRRGRPPGSKNKIPPRRKSSPESRLGDPEDDLIDESGPGIKTKYGRKVHAPQQFQPTQSVSRKRRPIDETHFCNICTRSVSPGHNKLIFCDNCDTPYHQLCHVPPISDAAVASNNKWFCSTCKPPLTLEGINQRLIGQGLSIQQKRAALQPLSKTHLEELVLFASDLYPTLPLFPSGDVDQFQVPQHHSTPREPSRMLDIEMNEHTQYNHTRLPEQNAQQNVSMTPVHDAPQPQGLDSPVYTGQSTDLPHYELMIVRALEAINDPNGSPPKVIWDWMNNNYPCNPKFRASASQALQKALKKGRLLKTGSLYKINPDFNPINAENPKATRKPQVGRSHPLFNQMHSRNNSIATLSSSPMSTPQQHTTPQQQQTQLPHQQPQPPPQPQQSLPPSDISPLGPMSGPLPSLQPRDHDPTPSYLDHNSVFGPTLTDPTTHPYGEPGQRPASSHDTSHVIPPFSRHHQL